MLIRLCPRCEISYKIRLKEIDARISIENEKASIEKNEKEKSRLLALSKAQQKAYLSDIGQKQARAGEIRSQNQVRPQEKPQIPVAADVNPRSGVWPPALDKRRFRTAAGWLRRSRLRLG